MPRLHIIRYPYYNQTLQEALVINFHAIEFDWQRLPENKEALAPTRMKRNHWAIIRQFLIQIITRLRQLQIMDILWDEHLP